MIRRDISSPQPKFEQRGSDAYRDVRPFSTRLSAELKGSVSGLVLSGLAAVTWFYPAAVNLTVPISLAYATWVMTRHADLPWRLPITARQKDWNYPDPETRKPRIADGTHFIGSHAITGQQIWGTASDIRQHASVPGTTGAGKTTSLIGQLTNPLARGGGFILVDGKGSNELYGEVLALCRRMGLEDNVLPLSFLVASGIHESATFNTFASGNADAIREILASQLGEPSPNDTNGLFRGRAVALLGTMSPVLVYMRDVIGISLNIETIRFALDLKGIWSLAIMKTFISRDTTTGQITEIPVPDIPEELVYPLQAYLGELPGYEISLPWNQQTSDKPSEQHGYAQFYFTAIFSQLAGSLGHIFKCESGDIDMRDVVLNRRILVVILPSLENSDDTLASLGRIVVASLRGMMAQMLGARLDGDPKEIFPLRTGSGDTPFHVVFDEIGAYATSGMDRMYQMGRGLNMAFWSAFQDVPGIYAKLGEKTHSLLGNANLTIGMRLQDGTRTKDWIEKTAGQTSVTQATSFQGGAVGQYRESRSAEVRQVARADWNDMQKLIEGEAIVFMAGRNIPAKLFRAVVDITGPMRFAQPLMLRHHRPAEVRTHMSRLRRMRESLTSGSVSASDPVGETPVLSALLDAFAAAATSGRSTVDCAKAAIVAAGEASNLSGNHGQTSVLADDRNLPPVTDMLPMLQALASPAPHVVTDPGMPANPISADLMRALLAVEVLATGSPSAARRNTLTSIAERDRASDRPSVAPRPGPMRPAELVELIDSFCSRIAA